MPVRFVQRYMLVRPAGVSRWDWLRNRAAAAFAMRSMLRPGECDRMAVSDIRFTPDGGMEIAPLHRKNDQYGEFSAGLWTPYEPSAMVDAMRSYAKLRGPAPGPFWLRSDGRPLRPGFCNALAKLLGGLADSSLLLSGHSFRIGGATAAAAAGIDVGTIQAIGGWRSQAVLLYIRRVAACHARVSARMGL
jgi:hypothetical protein